jgi:hypothetical protein
MADFQIPQPTEWRRIENKIDAAVGNWSAGRTTWIAGAHCDGKRFVVRADEKITAFLRLEAAIRVTSVELCFLRNCLAAQFAPQRTHCQQR